MEGVARKEDCMKLHPLAQALRDMGLIPSKISVQQSWFQAGYRIVDLTGASATQIENKYNCIKPQAAAIFIAHLNTLGLHPVATRDFPQSGWTQGGQFAQLPPAGMSGDGKVPYMDFTFNAADSVPTIQHVNVGGIAMQYLFGSQLASDYNCVNFWFKGAQ
jgi:hypothetical protein